MRLRRLQWCTLWIGVCALNGLQPCTADTIEVGYAECFRPRLPLEEFKLKHPEVEVAEVPFVRNAWGHPEDTPFAGDSSSLPQVFPIHVGRFSSDLRVLVERGAIEPIDTWLTELKLSAEMFPANIREAVTYRGELWAIPHHVVVDALHLHRDMAARAGIDVHPQSWEELFSLVARSTAEGDTASFSVAGTLLNLLECMLLSSGGPLLDLSSKDLWNSPRLVSALEIIQAAQSAGQLSFRPPNAPLRMTASTLLGIGRVESLHDVSPYEIVPFPTRLREQDEPAVQGHGVGMLEAYVVQANNSRSREAVLAYLRWLLSDETEWAAFEATNHRASEAPHVLDSVHVPLRASVLTSLDFDYALRKYPSFAVLNANVNAATFSHAPAALDYKAFQLVDTTMSRDLPGAPPVHWLPSLQESVHLLMKNTPVETRAYDAY